MTTVQFESYIAASTTISSNRFINVNIDFASADNVPPVISGCPSTIVLSPGVNVSNWDEPTAIDNSEEEPSVTKSHKPGSELTENMTTVVYTFTDAAGNQANCIFFVQTTPGWLANLFKEQV